LGYTEQLVTIQTDFDELFLTADVRERSKEKEGLIQYVAGVLTHICATGDISEEADGLRHIIEQMVSEADIAHKRICDKMGW
jgi:hypothetical protein